MRRCRILECGQGAKILFFVVELKVGLHALERLQVLGGMRQGAPAPVFQAVLDVVQPHLSPRDWAKLTQGLGLPAVPGLAAAV